MSPLASCFYCEGKKCQQSAGVTWPADSTSMWHGRLRSRVLQWGSPFCISCNPVPIVILDSMEIIILKSHTVSLLAHRMFWLHEERNGPSRYLHSQVFPLPHSERVSLPHFWKLSLMEMMSMEIKLEREGKSFKIVNGREGKTEIKNVELKEESKWENCWKEEIMGKEKER